MNAVLAKRRYTVIGNRLELRESEKTQCPHCPDMFHPRRWRSPKGCCSKPECRAKERARIHAERLQCADFKLEQRMPWPKEYFEVQPFERRRGGIWI